MNAVIHKSQFLTVPARKAITLMEVLISLGILSVGLASVVALVPAGGSQARLAMIDDVAMTVGNSAHADLINRGFLNPASWSPTQSGTYSIAVDPLGNAAFPSSVQKVTLNGIANNSTDAEAVFRWSDDLAYELPEADDQPPIPLYVGPTNRRLSEGNFSWFATLLPATNPPSGTYRLSVLTCYKREASSSLPSPLPASTIATNSDAVTVDAAGLNLTVDDVRGLFPRGSAALLSRAATFPAWRTVVMASPIEQAGAITGVELMIDKPLSFIPTEIFVFPGSVGITERIVSLEEGSPWSE
jgi:hypothetical protein